MTLLFKGAGLFIWGLNYAMGSVPSDLEELSAAGLIAGDASVLAQMGYHRCLSLGPDQTFLTLVSDVARRTLATTPFPPRSLLFQHGNFESATAPWEPGEPDSSTRYSYFPPHLMRELGIDDLPYFCLFAGGCAGFSLLLATAASQHMTSCGDGPILCLMGDRRTPFAPYDQARERILSSEHASTFALGREPAGYQVLGVSCYSTARTVVPLIELVKRTTQMISELADELGIDLRDPRLLIHYPNIFPDVWKLVTRSLRLKPSQHVMIGMAEWAHCGASDALISLAQRHECHDGRIHVAVTYGAGVHLAVSMLEEKPSRNPALQAAA